jgi:hypothetical protein
LGPATLAFQNAQNYDQSEVVARLTGPMLEHRLHVQKLAAPDTRVHVLAHSMGNVVMSEALRQHDGGQLVESYVPTQAATTSGSYDPLFETNTHKLLVDLSLFGPDELTADAAWRRYNTENTTSDYGMPPDIYRYTNMIVQENGQSVLRHGVTHSDTLELEFGPGTAYYAGIKGKAVRIVNFSNPSDTALNAWEFNQLTKPDTSTPNGEKKWRYSNEQLCRPDIPESPILWYYPDNTICDDPSVTQVTSRFYQDNVQMDWHSQTPEGFHAYAQIIGHIIPARTVSLGQMEKPDPDDPMPESSEISAVETHEGFTDSNQGHSAEFHGYLGDTEVSTRDDYWLDVMEKGFGILQREGNYSGLRPTGR